MRIADGWRLIRTAVRDWQDDKVPRLGAALAFYAIFSLAPLLVIAMAVGELAFGEDMVRGRVAFEMEGFFGRDGASAVDDLVKHASKHPTRGTFTTALGIFVLIFASIGVFLQLKDSLNTIWEVEPKPGAGYWLWIRDYVISFAMVGCIAILLLISLIFSTIVNATSERVRDIVPIPASTFFWMDWTLALLLTTLLFAALFKGLPDARVAWREVWIGSFLTAVLFTLGKVLLAFYFSVASIATTYGAAGSLMVVLLWTYYSAQILLFGAEFTHAYARAHGGGILPAPHARRVTSRERMEQGMEPLKPRLRQD